PCGAGERHNATRGSRNVPAFAYPVMPEEALRAEPEDQGIDWRVNLGVAVLGMVLVLSAAAALAFVILPLPLGRTRPHRRIRVIYFVSLGLGYIMVEIAFVQRLVLFLGHPTYALTVVVFLLLLSSGTGSVASQRWGIERGRLWFPIVLAAVGISIYVVILPSLLNALVALPFAAKLLS